MNKKEKVIMPIILIIGIIIYYLINQKYHIGLFCPFHKITNLYCPGCGITRMLFSIINLNFYQAFRYNPLVFILFIGFIIIKLIELIRGQKIILNNKIIYSLLIIVILYGILRNIPYFDVLAPTVIK